MNIRIYQIDYNRDVNRVMFMNWRFIEPIFDFSIYEKKWEGTVPNEYGLDDIYTMFNLNHPQDFRGHSLSVSDIVYMNGKYYFCDSIGWKCIG